MTGCGSKGESVEATEAVENTESTEEVPAVPLAQYDLKGSDYVTLCDYSAIPVTISGDYDVTDLFIRLIRTRQQWKRATL